MTFFKPKFASVPMKGPASREYASEYPQKIHWKVVLAIVLATKIFFDRVYKIIPNIHGYNHERLEKQRQRGLPSSQATVKQTNARDDQPDDESTEDNVGIVPFEAFKLSVHVDL
jgi:hypothetical protein